MRWRDRGEEAGRTGETGGGSESEIPGERGPSSVSGQRSLHSRASNILACALMLAVGAAMLTWYYTTALSRQRRVRHAAQTSLVLRAQSEMALPSLGRIGPESVSSINAAKPPSSELAPPPEVAPVRQAGVTMLPLGLAQPAVTGGGPEAAAKPPSPLERRLSGAAYAGAPPQADLPTPPSSRSNSPSDGELATLLKTDAVPIAQPHYLPTRSFLLAKGTFIDCTLETAIDSTLPGMTACVTATDTFGADGTVVLLERGTKLIGETRGQVQQGAARVFVVWSEARTPTGIVVPLDSPGTDELGRSGLAGQVDNHFWGRFGAAILVSTLDGAVQAAVQTSSRNTGTVIYNPTSSEAIVTDILKGTVNIPPTITKRNGDRIQVFAARDLDFRSVYALRTASETR